MIIIRFKLHFEHVIKIDANLMGFEQIFEKHVPILTVNFLIQRATMLESTEPGGRGKHGGAPVCNLIVTKIIKS